MVRLLLFGRLLFLLFTITFLFSRCDNCTDDECPIDTEVVELYLVDSLGNNCFIENPDLLDLAMDLTNADKDTAIISPRRGKYLLLLLYPNKNNYEIHFNDSLSFIYSYSRDSTSKGDCCGTPLDFTYKFTLTDKSSSEVICSNCRTIEIASSNCL